MSRGTLHVTENCRPATEVFQLVGDKWTMLVVIQLSSGSRRFSELRRELPNISQRMLTLSLRSLERDGLIKRTVTASVPPRVDYEITDLGRSFSERVFQLGRWAFDNKPAVDAARTTFDGRLEANARAISPAKTPAPVLAVAGSPVAAPADQSGSSAA